MAGLFVATHAIAQVQPSVALENKDQSVKRLKVAAYLVPPYATRDSTGQIEGHSVRLWRLLAAELGVEFDLVGQERLDLILADVAKGAVDVAIGAITVTEDRERLVDFSHPVHPSGVAIAVRKPSGIADGLSAARASLIELGPLLLTVMLLAIIAGLVVWATERRNRARSTAEPSNIASAGDGVYWAVVTMSTVGYGDKTPKSAFGKVIAMLWIFSGIVVTSIFTGTVTSKITATQMAAHAGPEIALRSKRLGAVNYSSGAEYLRKHGLGFMAFDSLPSALTALRNEEIDVVVNSRGALVHTVASAFSETIVMQPGDLTKAWMALAIPPDRRNAEALNSAILSITTSRLWTSERAAMVRDYGAGDSANEAF